MRRTSLAVLMLLLLTLTACTQAKDHHAAEHLAAGPHADAGGTRTIRPATGEPIRFAVPSGLADVDLVGPWHGEYVVWGDEHGLSAFYRVAADGTVTRIGAWPLYDGLPFLDPERLVVCLASRDTGRTVVRHIDVATGTVVRRQVGTGACPEPATQASGSASLH